MPATGPGKLRREIHAALAVLLDIAPKDVRALPAGRTNADLVLAAAGHTFVIEASAAATAGPLADRARQAVTLARRQRRGAIPVVVVPYMPEGGRAACQAAGASWFDLSGNAHIVAPGIRIIVTGRPDRFRRPGRPSSAFAPKSARVVRWLLIHPDRAFSQREIAHGTQMTEGFVSRIVSRLEAERYLVRAPGGKLLPRDPKVLLDAWGDEYRFDRHALIQGHVAARTGEALTRFVSDALTAAAQEHAATGLSAAWQMTAFATFRTATFYLGSEPTAKLLEKISFREGASGANLWLVLPNDAGVFQGAEVVKGVRCVHPVQAYLDLKAHPERSAEAAERLRSEYLNWKTNG